MIDGVAVSLASSDTVRRYRNFTGYVSGVDNPALEAVDIEILPRTAYTSVASLAIGETLTIEVPTGLTAARQVTTVGLTVTAQGSDPDVAPVRLHGTIEVWTDSSGYEDDEDLEADTTDLDALVLLTTSWSGSTLELVATAQAAVTVSLDAWVRQPVRSLA